MIKANGLTASGVRWNLDCLYADIDDPRIQRDLQRLAKMAEYRLEPYRLSAKSLEATLAGLIDFRQLADRIRLYIRLLKKLNVGPSSVDAAIDRLAGRLDRLEEGWFQSCCQALSALSPTDAGQLAERSSLIRHHLPWLEIQRFHRQHAKRSGSAPDLETAAHHAQRDHRAALLAERFPHPYASWRLSLNLSGILNLINNDPSPQTRWRAQRSLNSGLRHPKFSEQAAAALRTTVAWRQADCRDRGYGSAMEPRNLMNDLSATAVEALHQSLAQVGPKLIAEHYGTKAGRLKQPRLFFSDLNAPWDGQDDRDGIGYAEARLDLIAAIAAFDPELSRLAERLTAPGRVDAEPRPNKASGANNAAAVLKDGPRSFILVNWHGQERNRYSLAHEVGHALRAEVAGCRQGPLLSSAPMIMSEAISMFMEALTFRHQLERAGPDQRLRRLRLGSRLDRLLESSVRQVCVSCFERRLYDEPDPLTSGLISDLWRETHRRFYGPTDGLFEYRHFSHRWAHLLHLHRPFAVYGYAAAQIVALALLERSESSAVGFRKRFRALLANGQAERTGDLLKPLGLDLEDTDFWTQTLTRHYRRLREQLLATLD